MLDENDEPIGTDGKFLMLRENDQAQEMITLQRKLGEKLWKEGKNIKFPIPARDALHIILIDERGACGGDGLDVDQRRQLVYGPDYPELEDVYSIGKQNVPGIFDTNNKLPYAVAARERIDTIAMICEREFELGEIRSKTSYYFNYEHGRDFKTLGMKIPLRTHYG